MSVPVGERDRLADLEAKLERIEASLARLEAMLEQAHGAIMPVLANPGRLLAKMMGGGK